MDDIRNAILTGDYAAVADLPVPDSYQGMVVRKDEVDMFEGLATRDKDPRKSLHVDEVETPQLGPGEAIVAVMASSVNFNTVWTSIFEPVSTFGFLERYGRLNELSKRHDLPYHVVGSDLSGVVLAVGPGVQQVAYTVEDVEAVSATLRERGLRLLYDAPRRGTSDSRVNFIHPKDAGGVLVELVQPAASAH